MPNTLKVAFPQKCIGCELCVAEAQRQLKKVGLEGSLIRILRNKKENSEFIEYSIDLDPHIDRLDIESIGKTCPTEVFEIVREENNDPVK